MIKKIILFKFLIFILIPASVFAQWEQDVRLTYNDSASTTNINNAWSVAANRDTIHITWSDQRDGNSEIYYKRSINGGTDWDPDIRITNNSASSGQSSVGVAGLNVHIIWQDDRDGNGEIYYKRSTSGGSFWGSDIRLTNNSVNSDLPSVAVSGTNVHMVCQERWEGHQIYYKRSTDNGANWGPTTRISYIYSFADGPSIAVTGINVHVAFWDARSGGSGRIFYKRSTNNGTNWSEDTPITADTIGAEIPCVVVSGLNIHLTWNSLYGPTSRRDIYYKQSTDAGINWGQDYCLTNHLAPALGPSIAVSGSNVHIVWYDSRNGDYEIYYKRSIDGGITWEPEIRLTNSLGNSINPSIAVSGPMVHVIWCDNRDGNYEIYYKRNPNGNVGIEEKPSNILQKPRFCFIPNPFVSHAQVPMHEDENFVLYDRSGKRVGIYKGRSIGENLPPGVYFIKCLNYNSPFFKIVKIK